MKAKILLLITIAVISVLLAGCWDYVEYENIMQVAGLGIDFNKETREITLSVQFISSGLSDKSGSSGKTTRSNQGPVYSAVDATIIDALSKLQQAVAKKIYFSYVRIIVIGDDAARYIMGDIMESLDRSTVIRSTAYICVASGKAEELLYMDEPTGTQLTSLMIYNLINQTKNTGAAYPVSIHDFAEILANSGVEPAIPHIIAKFANSTGKPDEAAADGEVKNIRVGAEIYGNIRAAGIAAFNGDKLVGWLNEDESRGLSLIKGIRLKIYETSKVSDKTDTKDILSFGIIHAKSKIKPKMVNEKPAIYIDVKVEAVLNKYYTTGKGEEIDFFTPDKVSLMEKVLADSLRMDIDAALKKGCRELKSDIFGFGFEIFRKYQKLWHGGYEKEWPDIFPKIPVYVNVKAKIRNTGTNISEIIVR